MVREILTYINSVFVFALSALAVISKSVAENIDYYDGSDLLVDIPLVSSGARMEQQRYYSPSSVTVIDSEMITAMAPTNLVDLFRLVPAF